MSKIILTDSDGVLLNWEYAFGIWMERQGYELVEGHQFMYQTNEKYNIPRNLGQKLCRQFNESAMVGFIPALRDAVHYVKLLYERHGYKFHVITSFSSMPEAQTLRKQNLTKLFGDEVFDGFTILGTGDDKDYVLEKYRGSGLWWIEDKPSNIIAGLKVGLKPILMEHGHNMNEQWTDNFPIVTDWKGIYEVITNSER